MMGQSVNGSVQLLNFTLQVSWKTPGIPVPFCFKKCESGLLLSFFCSGWT